MKYLELLIYRNENEGLIKLKTSKVLRTFKLHSILWEIYRCSNRFHLDLSSVNLG